MVPFVNRRPDFLGNWGPLEKAVTYADLILPQEEWSLPRTTTTTDAGKDVVGVSTSTVTIET